MKNLYLSILLFFLFTSNAFGQDYALFLHGFEGSEESWLNSGTPDDWVTAGIIDDYIAISYDVADLASSSSQAQLINSIASQMSQKSSTGNWVIVGHSMGGLVARAGYEVLDSHPLLPQANIKAVLTVGTPHQGARAAHVALSNTPGYINVKPVLDEFIFRVEEPLDDVHGAVSWFAQFSPGALDQLEKIPEIKNDVIGHIEYFSNASVNNNVKNIIGLNGSLIQTINSGQVSEPSFKRSVIGAEKKFIVVRSANEIVGDRNGNELGALDNFNDIRYFYKANSNAWEASRIAYKWTLQNGKKRDAERKRDRWRTGRNTLDNIDGTWGEMIDSYTIGTVIMSMYVMVDCQGQPGDPTMPGHSDGEEICWELQDVPFSYPVATKNDIIIGPEYAVWNPNEDPDDGDINWYYDDVPADGGYNHFELRRHKRAYTLSGVFQQGELAPPMRDAALWLDDEVFNN